MTKNSEKRVPALRFKGFTNDWEQRKLGEVTQRVQGNDNNMNRPVLTISAKTGWMTQSNRFSSIIAGSEKKKYTLLKKGELSYNHGNSKIAPFGTVFMLNNYSEALVPKVYHSFKANYYMNPYFLELYFHTKKLDPQLRKFISSSARMDGLLNITYKWFEKIFIFSPQLSEQNKLEKIFLLINKYISLQQRKLDILIKLNRNIIINLFKEIRVNHHAIELKHTASNWKSARLKELGICQSGFGFPIKEQNGSKGIPFFKVSDFNTFGNEIYLQYANNYVTNHQIRKNKWKIFDQVPAIVFAKVGAAIFLNRKRMINEPFLIDNNLMAFELNLQKLDYKFAKILFDNMYLPKFAQVGALPSYNASDINAIKVKIPDMDSQKKIANIIMKNNNEIILQKQILQKGKELKQFLLQNMFI